MTLLQRSLALVALLAFLALSTVGVAAVVCVGSDGHVALETLASGCCGADDTPAADSAPCDPDAPQDEHEDDCGGCVDSLLAQLRPLRKTGGEPPDTGSGSMQMRAGSVVDRVALAPVSETRRDSRAPPRPPPRLSAHLKITVLLL